MDVETIILAVIGLAIPLAGAVWARWSRARLERNDPARRRPAE